MRASALPAVLVATAAAPAVQLQQCSSAAMLATRGRRHRLHPTWLARLPVLTFVPPTTLQLPPVKRSSVARAPLLPSFKAK